MPVSNITKLEQLLSLPYRDRNLIIVVRPDRIPAAKESPFRRLNPKSWFKSLQAEPPVAKEVLTPYYSKEKASSLNYLNPKNWLKKEIYKGITDTEIVTDTTKLVTDTAKIVADTATSVGRNLVDTIGKFSWSKKPDPSPYQKIPATLAESFLKFPPGHPHYDTAYACHPLKSTYYIPVANFHHELFKEKVLELWDLFAGLGAKNFIIRCINGYKTTLKSELSCNIDVPAEIPIGASSSRERNSLSISVSEAILSATFTPKGDPHLPVWYNHDETWQRLADDRLNSGLKEIDFTLRYDDDFGVTNRIADELVGIGFNLGGDFQKFERTEWSFHCSFE